MSLPLPISSSEPQATMAPKRHPQIDDLPAAAAVAVAVAVASASSDDETEEQEEDSSDDEEEQRHGESKPKKWDPEQVEDESEESDDEEAPVLKKQSVQKFPSSPQSESSEGSGSGSDSDGTLNSPSAFAFTIKPIASKPMEISPKPKKPTQLKPSAKRPAETEQNGSASMNKKSKVSNGDAEDGPGKKFALNRLWSEDDEIVILKGMIDYQKEKGSDPYLDMTAFHEFVKDLLSVDVSKSQMTEKIRRLKKKYQNNAENGEDPVFSKPHEYKAFELSKKIWGGRVRINGVDESKVMSSKRKDKKKDENVVNKSVPKLMENTKEIVLQDAVKDEIKEEVEVERMDFWSMYPRLSESLESETYIYLSLPKEAKNIVKERIKFLGREKVSQLEEKWKDIREMECNLYAKRLELIHEQMQMVLNEMKSSKS